MPRFRQFGGRRNIRRPLSLAVGGWLPALLLSVSIAVSAQTPPVANVQGMAGDFDIFCRFVAEEYAYFDIKQTQWDKACAELRPRAVAANDRATLIPVLESALAELYDFHAHLGTSLPDSPRLVPTGAEMWASMIGDAAVIEDVREDSAAYKAGMRPGMHVLAIDGQPIAAAVRERMPRMLRATDTGAESWALQSVLAGRQNGIALRLTVAANPGTTAIEFVPRMDAQATLITTRKLDRGLVVIRFNNSLGVEATIKDFDAQLAPLTDLKGLVLDLRDTPSGGTSQVARGIMSRLVQSGGPYQVHELVAEARAYGVRRRWIEYVMPRGDPVNVPVVVLVGRWTGSMGEGLAIGLNAVAGAAVIGIPMAQLLGALGEVKLPASGIVVRIPTEKLFHVNGTPREAFVPCPVAAASAPGADPALQAALAMLAGPDGASRPATALCAGPVRP